MVFGGVFSSPFANGAEERYFSFGGDLVASGSREAAYSVDGFEADIGLPLEGISSDGETDRFSDAHFYLDRLTFETNPFPSILQPHLARISVLNLGDTLDAQPNLFSLRAENQGAVDEVVFEATVSGGNAGFMMSFWMDHSVHFGRAPKRAFFGAGSEVAIQGLAVSGPVGELRWIVQDWDGGWFVSKGVVSPSDAVLDFLSDEDDGEWAPVSGPQLAPGQALVYEMQNFSDIISIGFATITRPFAVSNNASVRFTGMTADVETEAFPFPRPKSDVLVGRSLNRLKGGDRYGGEVGPIFKVILKKRGRFFLIVQNDGLYPRSLQVQNYRKAKRSRVRVRDAGGGNVTAGLRRGIMTKELEPDEGEVYRVLLRAKGGNRSRMMLDYLGFRSSPAEEFAGPEADRIDPFQWFSFPEESDQVGVRIFLPKTRR